MYLTTFLFAVVLISFEWKALGPVCHACKALADRAAAMAQDMNKVKNVFGDWSKTEVDLSHNEIWEYPNKDGRVLHTLLGEVKATPAAPMMIDCSRKKMNGSRF